MKDTYLELIEDTLSFAKGLLPDKVVIPSLPKLEEEKVIAPPPKVAKPIPATPKAVKQEAPPSDLKRSPPPAPPKESLETMKRLLAEVAPDLYLHDAPLTDEKAKYVKDGWKIKSQTPDVPILFQGSGHRSFLDNVAKAISRSFAPSRVIEIEKGKKWDLFLESPNLKFILIPDHLLFSSKELLPYYKENPGQKTRFLGQVPLLLLPDLSLYFKDPYLKRFLWNVICQTLSQV